MIDPYYSDIPDHMIDSLQRYVHQHIPTGGFLAAVLANDLMEAMGRADEESQRALPKICAYVYNEIPIACHGSWETVTEWLATKPDAVA